MKRNKELLLRCFWIVLISLCCFMMGAVGAVFSFIGLITRDNVDEIPDPGVVLNTLGVLLLPLTIVALCVYYCDDEIMGCPTRKGTVWKLWFFHCALLLFMPALIVFDLLHHSI